jgi:uncharacterized membrane protein
VSKKLRDLVITIATLLVLFGGLASINPRLREQTAQMVSEPGWATLRGMATDTFMTGFSFVHDYADFHTYLFSFLIAACVFAFLMIRIIS